MRSRVSLTGTLSTLTIVSPGRTPAFSAGLPASTDSTNAPSWAFRSKAAARSASTLTMLIPRKPRTTFPLSRSWGRIVLSVLIGTAKPMFWAGRKIAVLMPTTSPLMLSSGPPELPKLIAASVWM